MSAKHKANDTIDIFKDMEPLEDGEPTMSLDDAFANPKSGKALPTKRLVVSESLSLDDAFANPKLGEPIRASSDANVLSETDVNLDDAFANPKVGKHENTHTADMQPEAMSIDDAFANPKAGYDSGAGYDTDATKEKFSELGLDSALPVSSGSYIASPGSSAKARFMPWLLIMGILLVGTVVFLSSTAADPDALPLAINN